MPALLETVPTATATNPVVASLANITKRYSNGVVALDNLSLNLHRGQIVALLGPNGAGKSTAVRLMMGLTSATSGDVRVFNADPRLTSTRLRTGVMLQVGRAPEMLRVREHITIFRGYYPNPMPYAELVKAAGLEEIETRFFGELSGGQKQRMLFALALAGDPDLIFLDEPTVGLDIEARRAMWATIRGLAARGKTVLLTTHYLEEADALAHRIVVINKGKVVCSGTPAEVKSISLGSAAGANSTAIKIIRCVKHGYTGGTHSIGLSRKFNRWRCEPFWCLKGFTFRMKLEPPNYCSNRCRPDQIHAVHDRLDLFQHVCRWQIVGV